MLLYLDGVLDSLASMTVKDGRIQEVHVVRNPDKLGYLLEPVTLSRR